MTTLQKIDRAVFVANQAAEDDITTPVFTEFRRASGQPVKTVSYTQSAIVDSSGQAPDQVYDNFELNAALESEFSDSSVEYLRRAIHGTTTLIDVTSTTIASTSSGFDSGAANAFANLEVGDYFYVSGFADADLNTWHHILVKADDNIVVTSTTPASVEAAGESVTVYSRKTTSGKVRYYDIVQERIDTKYQSFYNGAIDTASVSIGESGIVGMSLGYVFSKKLDQETAIAGQTDGAEDLSNSYSAAVNVKGFFANGVSQTCKIKSMNFEINNGYSSDSAAGCGDKVIAKNSINAQATISARAQKATPFAWTNLSENQTDTSFAAWMQNKAGDQDIVIAMDRCKVTDAVLTDGDVFTTSDFTAIAQGSTNQDTTITIYTNY